MATAPLISVETPTHGLRLAGGGQVTARGTEGHSETSPEQSGSQLPRQACMPGKLAGPALSARNLQALKCQVS